MQALLTRAVKTFERLDVVFNNAGIGGAIGPIDETSVEDWDRTQAVLLRSVFLGMKHAVPLLRRSGGGSIISTASVAGLRAGAGPHAYSAAKAAVSQPDPLRVPRSRQGQHPRQLHLSRRHQHAL